MAKPKKFKKGEEVIFSNKQGELFLGTVYRVRVEVVMPNGKKTLISQNSIVEM